jgi:multiple sugar transport system permease protein
MKMKSNHSIASNIKRTLFYIPFVLLLFYLLFPFLWQFMTSIKTQDVLYKSPPVWFPSHLTLASYVDVFTKYNFLRYLTNSVIVAVSTTCLAILFSSLSAYAVAKMRFKGKKLLMAVTLSASMFPPIAIACPLFVILKSVDMINTLQGLIVVYLTFSLPFALWNQSNFFRKIPSELVEAASIDGCTPLKTLFNVILPLAAPGTFTTAILVFISAFNEFTFALVFNIKDTVRTVPVGITMFPGLHDYPWGDIAAASVIVTVPLIIMVLICQRWIIEGLTAGAVKG